MMWMTVVAEGRPMRQRGKLNADALRARLREARRPGCRRAGPKRLASDRSTCRPSFDKACRGATRQHAAICSTRNGTPSLPPLASGSMVGTSWRRACGPSIATTRHGSRQQMAEIGWFDIGKYGAAADKDAWLLVQHADRSKHFQRETLADARSHCPRARPIRAISPIYMTAWRWARAGRSGTARRDNVSLTAPGSRNESEDPAGVDARRKALGLAPHRRVRAHVQGRLQVRGALSATGLP